MLPAARRLLRSVPVRTIVRSQFSPPGWLVLETDWHTFKPRLEGEVLSGIYGPRFVEHLLLGRFDDEFERPTDVLKARLGPAGINVVMPGSLRRAS